MIEEVALKAKKLYEEKSKLSDSLSRIIDVKLDGVTYHLPNYFSRYYPNIELEFCRDELKEWVVTKLKNELLRVETELHKLNC